MAHEPRQTWHKIQSSRPLGKEYINTLNYQANESNFDPSNTSPTYKTTIQSQLNHSLDLLPIES